MRLRTLLTMGDTLVYASYHGPERGIYTVMPLPWSWEGYIHGYAFLPWVLKGIP